VINIANMKILDSLLFIR